MIKNLVYSIFAVTALTILIHNLFSLEADFRQKIRSSTSISQNQKPKISRNPFRYCGYYEDSESGNYYLKARYYSPTLLRFISRDTYDLSNRYAYCKGNPVTKIDPNGHHPTPYGGLSFGMCMIGTIINISDIASGEVVGTPSLFLYSTLFLNTVGLATQIAAFETSGTTSTILEITSAACIGIAFFTSINFSKLRINELIREKKMQVLSNNTARNSIRDLEECVASGQERCESLKWENGRLKLENIGLRDKCIEMEKIIKINRLSEDLTYVRPGSTPITYVETRAACMTPPTKSAAKSPLSVSETDYLDDQEQYTQLPDLLEQKQEPNIS